MPGFHAVPPGYIVVVLILGVLLISLCDGFCNEVIAREKADRERGQEYLATILSAPAECGYVWAEQVRSDDPDTPGGIYARDPKGNTYTLAEPDEVYGVWNRLQRAGVKVHLSAPAAAPA